VISFSVILGASKGGPSPVAGTGPAIGARVGLERTYMNVRIQQVEAECARGKSIEMNTSDIPQEEGRERLTPDVALGAGSSGKGAPLKRTKHETIGMKTIIAGIIGFVLGNFPQYLPLFQQWWDPHLSGSVNFLGVGAPKFFLSHDLTMSNWQKIGLSNFIMLVRLTNTTSKKIGIVDCHFEGNPLGTPITTGYPYFVEFDFRGLKPTYIDFSTISLGALAGSKQLDPGETMEAWGFPIRQARPRFADWPGGPILRSHLLLDCRQISKKPATCSSCRERYLR
jgi:hypothetical protein